MRSCAYLATTNGRVVGVGTIDVVDSPEQSAVSAVRRVAVATSDESVVATGRVLLATND